MFCPDQRLLPGLYALDKVLQFQTQRFRRRHMDALHHTLLAVLHTWLHTAGGFREPMERVLRLGGDTDTTAAILGGILGGNLGVEAIPQPWLPMTAP